MRIHYFLQNVVKAQKGGGRVQHTKSESPPFKMGTFYYEGGGGHIFFFPNANADFECFR